MHESKSGFNIMNLLSQSAAKINAMEDMNVKKGKFKNKMPSTATRCSDTVSMVYHYMRGVNPSLASTLLGIHPNIDMDCKVTLEEVVQKWKRMADKAAVPKGKVEVCKDSRKGKGFLKDDSLVLQINKEKTRNKTLILDDVDNAVNKYERN